LADASLITYIEQRCSPNEEDITQTHNIATTVC
jgi:hypothetical protein